MSLPDVAVQHYREQQRLTLKVLAFAREVWGRRPPADFDAWFARNGDELLAIVVDAQLRAVKGADLYVGDTLVELGTPVSPDVVINPEAMAGVASDGRPLDSLMFGAVVNASERVEDRGRSAAWESGFNWLAVVLQTQLADIARSASQLAIASRKNVGYVRMLNPPSCSRCVILAGRFYRSSSAFRRHPGCDCRHIASLEDNSEDIRTDPQKYFNSLTEAEQNRAFTRSGAEAIRLGADVGQVVNVRRGATGLDSAAGSTGRLQRQDVYGRSLLTSTEGVTKRGVAGKVIRARGRDPRTTPRLMPESILEVAESRDDAMRLLRLNGYVLDRTGPATGAGSRTSLVPDIKGPAPTAKPVVKRNPKRPKMDEVTDTTIDRVRRAQLADNEALLADTAKHAGVTPAVLSERANDGLRKFAEDKNVAINMRDASFASFMRDGRYKTQYETGSGANYDPTLRANYEQAWFGKDSDVPVYGYMRSRGGEKSGADVYGGIALVLRDDVKDSMTVTVGDSMGMMDYTVPGSLGSPGRFTGSPVRAAKVDSADGYADYLATTHYSSSYVEAQVRRQVTVDDVAEVVFRKPPTPAQVSALADKGIAFSVVELPAKTRSVS